MIDNPTKDQLRDHALAILAHLNGEPWQVDWPGIGWDESKFPIEYYLQRAILLRPAPAPKMRPWSKPEDVPINCWIKASDHAAADCFVSEITDEGISFGHNPALRLEWRSLRAWTYSTDRVTWKKCEVPEP